MNKTGCERVWTGCGRDVGVCGGSEVHAGAHLMSNRCVTTLVPTMAASPARRCRQSAAVHVTAVSHVTRASASPSDRLPLPLLLRHYITSPHYKPTVFKPAPPRRAARPHSLPQRRALPTTRRRRHRRPRHHAAGPSSVGGAACRSRVAPGVRHMPRAADTRGVGGGAGRAGRRCL